MYQGFFAADRRRMNPPGAMTRKNSLISRSTSAPPGVNQSRWSIITALVIDQEGRPRSTLQHVGERGRISQEHEYGNGEQKHGAYLMIESVCKRNASIAAPLSPLRVSKPLRVRYRGHEFRVYFPRRVYDSVRSAYQRCPRTEKRGRVPTRR